MLHAVTDEECRPENGADDSRARLCSHCAKLFEAWVGGDQDHTSETILNCVPRAPEFNLWTLDKEEFDVMIFTREEAALGPDALHHPVWLAFFLFTMSLTVRRFSIL